MILKEVYNRLETLYPYEIKCMLDYSSPWQLLVSARLSAQCTDKRVNIVTKTLFSKYKDEKALANANISDVAGIIKPCGLFNVKANNIVDMCKEIQEHGIPDEISELAKLPGIGRKTANLVAGEIFGKQCVVVDTHMLRICSRLNLINTKNPEKAEKFLLKAINEYSFNGLRFSHMVVTFGREVCIARKPQCVGCVMEGGCRFKKASNT